MIEHIIGQVFTNWTFNILYLSMGAGTALAYTLREPPHHQPNTRHQALHGLIGLFIVVFWLPLFALYCVGHGLFLGAGRVRASQVYDRIRTATTQQDTPARW